MGAEWLTSWRKRETFLTSGRVRIDLVRHGRSPDGVEHTVAVHRWHWRRSVREPRGTNTDAVARANAAADRMLDQLNETRDR